MYGSASRLNSITGRQRSPNEKKTFYFHIYVSQSSQLHTSMFFNYLFGPFLYAPAWLFFRLAGYRNYRLFNEAKSRLPINLKWECLENTYFEVFFLVNNGTVKYYQLFSTISIFQHIFEHFFYSLYIEDPRWTNGTRFQAGLPRRRQCHMVSQSKI